MLFPDQKSPKKYEIPQREQIKVPDPNFFLRPAFVLPALALILIVGVMLVWQINLKLPSPEEANAENIARAQREIKTLRIALERFKIDCGRYPTTEEGLKALVLNPGIKEWKRNYINFLRSDPWRTPYYYEYTNDTVFLCSFGPDKIKGTADDIIAQTPTPEEVDWPPNSPATTNIEQISTNSESSRTAVSK
jgi:general secretion pathway protein G